MRAILFAAFLPLAACGNADDRPAGAQTGAGSRSFAVADFTGVELRGPDDVEVRIGDAFSVRAEGDPAVLDKLRIERVGDSLRVGRVKSGWNWGGGEGARVFVTMPRITAATLAGSGDMTIDRAEADGFSVSLAGSGNLSVAALRAETAELSLMGSGDLSARGAAGALSVSVAGSGDVRADGLVARRADVSVAGSGNVAARVDGPARVSIVGSGDVTLGPKARCETSRMGSGEVRCG